MLARLSTAFSSPDTTDDAIPHPRDVNPRLAQLEDQIDQFKTRLKEHHPAKEPPPRARGGRGGGGRAQA